MYAFAICDDDPVAVSHIARKIESFFQAQNCAVAVDPYTSAVELEYRLDNGSCYDGLLLDIDMPDLDGIELCRRFRKNGGEALVVFISNRTELVFQTFEVSPFRFIRKNHFSEEIDRVCQDMMTQFKRNEVQWLRFSNEKDDTVYAINIQKLIYVETYGKLCRLRSSDGEKEVRISFGKIAEKLSEFNFIQPHRSYLINPTYIYRIDADTVLLDNGEQIPISKYRREKTKEAYFIWCRNGR